MKTDDETLIIALRILAAEIQSDDGVANACITEAANRLEELTAIVFTTWERWHLIDRVNKDMLRLQDMLEAMGKSIQREDMQREDPRLCDLSDKLLRNVPPRSEQ